MGSRSWCKPIGGLPGDELTAGRPRLLSCPAHAIGTPQREERLTRCCDELPGEPPPAMAFPGDSDATGRGKELIDYFMSNPKTQNIRIEQQDSVDYPEITVCPGTTWNYTALKLYNLTTDFIFGIQSFDSLELLNMTFSEALDFFTLKDFFGIGKELIDYFMSNPKTQNIRIEQQESVDYPEITVCPGTTWNYTALKLYNLTTDFIFGIQSFDSLELLNMTFSEALDFFTLKDFFGIVSSCVIPSFSWSALIPTDCFNGFGWISVNGTWLYETEAGQWRETRILDYALGWPLKVCYTFQAHRVSMRIPSTSPVMELVLNFQDFDPKDDTRAFYEIRIDSQEDPFTIARNVISSPVCKWESFPLSMYNSNKEFMISKNGSPPFTLPLLYYDYQKCLESALTEEFLKEAPCVLPSILPNSPDAKPRCNTSEEEKRAFDHYGKTQYYFNPGCPRRCKRATYSVTPLQLMTNNWVSTYLTDRKSQVVGIQFNIPTAEVETVEEQELTSLPQFLSDFGGMVGLYLGFSILGFYECLEALVVWIKFRFFSGRSRPAKGLFDYFTSNPLAQNIRIEGRASADFPEITVCPGVTWNYTALKLLGLTLDEAHYYIWSGSVQKYLNMSFLEALDFFSMKDFTKIVTDCTIYPHKCSLFYDTDWTWINGSRVYQTDAGYWRESRILNSPYDWPMKVCYSFHANSMLRMALPSTSSVMDLTLNFKDFDPEYILKRSFGTFYEIRIDSQEDPFTAVRNVTSSGQTFFLSTGSSYMLSLSLTYYNFLPSGGKCNADENYDYQKVIGDNHLILQFQTISREVISHLRIDDPQCLETALTENFLKEGPCAKPSVLPSTQHLADMKPQCNTSEDEKNLFNYYNDVQHSYDPGCLRKCRRTTYKVIPFQEAALPPNTQGGVIRLNTPIAEAEILEEQELTSLVQFLSDFGGMIGLYLGFSLLTVYEFFEAVVVWVKPRFFNAQAGLVHP
ncbi:unnamed protein product [Darwinula stevensoni]|uniref:Uncharacterized protein n=1 Tax=Darwinula stevensoni TaxID=69355 RepID=A0A7R9A2Z4_9CRUS|nr:unnamed protein product [Darwinula stevensoni]CAG0886694.1 unnamed protein product [Darwinula stevensoni]